VESEPIPIYMYGGTADNLSWDGFKESIYAFVYSVEWSQPWLKAILSFHIITLITLIQLRNNTNALAVVTFSLMALAAFSKVINSIAHNHWQEFSTHDYFDDSGFFISMIFSFPVLVNAIVGIVSVLDVLHRAT
ncbi:9323_t:CDS:2, partial [Acaulospora morrowiae]